MLTCAYQKGNETRNHYILKQLSRIIAFNLGYKIGAEEVDMFSVNDFGRKNIADYIGLKYIHKWVKGKYEDDIKSICIEAKQSKSDYKNGFVSSCDVNYIITPKGLLNKEDMLKGVGLIEVDFDELKIDYKHMEIIKGVTVVKRAGKADNLNSFKDETWSNKINLLRKIAYRSTVETMFIRHGLKE